jgi:hypothetical protein
MEVNMYRLFEPESEDQTESPTYVVTENHKLETIKLTTHPQKCASDK